MLEFCPKQGKAHKIAADLRKILNSLSQSDGRDFLEKNLSNISFRPKALLIQVCIYKGKYSDVLRAWVPSSSELNAAANVPSTSSCVALLKGYSDEKQKEEKYLWEILSTTGGVIPYVSSCSSREADDDTNQDDVEEIEEQRFLSHDFESRLKAGQWRNQGDGFAFIDTRRPSGFQFSTSVPLPSRQFLQALIYLAELFFILQVIAIFRILLDTTKWTIYGSCPSQIELNLYCLGNQRSKTRLMPLSPKLSRNRIRYPKRTCLVIFVSTCTKI